MSELHTQTVPDNGVALWPAGSAPWVVCAALRNRHTRRIICGPRHFDPTMRGQIETDSFWNWRTAEQGFVDQRGNFLTREEAHKIATENGQRRKRCGGDQTKLFSENLY